MYPTRSTAIWSSASGRIVVTGSVPGDLVSSTGRERPASRIGQLGVGSMPGTDPRVAAEISVGETEFAFLPELPARGLGADMVAAAAVLLLVDMPMDVAPSGYRLSGRQSGLSRRGQGLPLRRSRRLRRSLGARRSDRDRPHRQSAGLRAVHARGIGRIGRWPQDPSRRGRVRPTWSNRWPKVCGYMPTMFRNGPAQRLSSRWTNRSSAG